MSIFHRRQRAQPNPKNFICDICQITNSSLSNLNRHKKKDQGKKRKTLSETSQNQRKTKQNHEQSITWSEPIKQWTRPSRIDKSTRRWRILCTKLYYQWNRWCRNYCVTKDESADGTRWLWCLWNLYLLFYSWYDVPFLDIAKEVDITYTFTHTVYTQTGVGTSIQARTDMNPVSAF